MPNSSSPNARDKFVSLVKQATAIEFNLMANDDVLSDSKVIRQITDDESLVLNNANLTNLQRAQRRTQLEQARQQQNLEQVFSLAVEYLNPSANLDRVELDWLMKFSNLAKGVYSSTMQELWAKILAVEVESAGSFSYRSLKTLAELSSKEAILFYKAVNLMCRIGEDRSEKIITGVYKKPTIMSVFLNNNRKVINIAKLGLSYSQIITLAELGLLHEHEIESAPFVQKDLIKLTYQNESFEFVAKSREVIFTYYKFTQTGYELCRLVSADRNTKFIQQIQNDFNGLLELKGSGVNKV